MLTPKQIAKIVHAANREFRKLVGQTETGAWAELPEARRKGIEEGVVHALAHPDTTPEESHERWLASMKAQGHTPADHPCMRPRAELPWEDRVKDDLFLGIVKALKSGYPTL